jgi:hypothetical protein
VNFHFYSFQLPHDLKSSPHFPPSITTPTLTSTFLSNFPQHYHQPSIDIQTQYSSRHTQVLTPLFIALRCCFQNTFRNSQLCIFFHHHLVLFIHLPFHIGDSLFLLYSPAFHQTIFQSPTLLTRYLYLDTSKHRQYAQLEVLRKLCPPLVGYCCCSSW